MYDSQAVRLFVGIDLSHESAPDATTLLKFRRLLETHPLTQKIFTAGLLVFGRVIRFTERWRLLIQRLLGTFDMMENHTVA